MPHAAVVGASNALLSTQSTIRLVREFPDAYELLGTPGSLGKVARQVLGVKGAEAAYIDAIPVTVQEAMRAAIYASASQDKPVQISYKPAVEFEVQILDYGQALHVQLLGPYEAASPGVAYARKAARGGTRKTTRKATRKKARPRGR